MWVVWVWNDIKSGTRTGRGKLLMFQVRKTQCETCIYRKDSPLDLEELERKVKDDHGFFSGYRICHKHINESNVCCRGFWNKRGRQSTATQIASRLRIVYFSDKGEENV